MLEGELSPIITKMIDFEQDAHARWTRFTENRENVLNLYHVAAQQLPASDGYKVVESIFVRIGSGSLS